jgi:CBS domain-containing membrane protein
MLSIPELELSDDEFLDTMGHIPGFLDISTQDFRAIYHLAHANALERLFQHAHAGNPMCNRTSPLRPDTQLDKAARSFVQQGCTAPAGGG